MLRAVDQKHLESFEMWCWRRMEKISWTDHVRNEEVLLRVKKQSNILHEIRKWKANWIGHILRRNCLLHWVIEGKIKGGIEVTGRRGRKRRKLLDDLKERRGYSYLKEKALDRTVWRARFGRGFGPVVRQTTKPSAQKYTADMLSFRMFDLMWSLEHCAGELEWWVVPSRNTSPAQFGGSTTFTAWWSHCVRPVTDW